MTPTPTGLHYYITLDKFRNVADCVVDVDVFYPPAARLTLGGVCARHFGGAGENGVAMTKLQDNSAAGTGSYNTLWLYERPGLSTLVTIAPPTTKATVRMIVKGMTAWEMADVDMDGVFDFTSAARALANAATPAVGLIGCTGANVSELDSFKLFDGALLPDTTTSPKIGTTFKMTFSAPLTLGLPTVWMGLLSMGRAGIPLDPGRALPLSLDAMLVASLSLGITGLLTTQTPEGTISIPIPNNPALVGLKLWAAAFTVDGSKPLSIGAISNDHQLTITP